MSVRRAKRVLIVPIFIPDQGCPHQCIFCQQEKITSQSNQVVDVLHIRKIVDQAIASARFGSSIDREIAFYGGSFTSLSVTRMTELLEAVSPYLKKGLFKSVRISTRPDEVDEERIDLIKRLGVSTVELGVQSMDDNVLRLSMRGHTAGDTVESVKLLKRHGFRVGVQLMPGLPGDSEEGFLKSVEEVIKLQPDMARLYPTVVIRETGLDTLYKADRYQPLTLEAAVRICQESCIRLEDRGIPVIRIGLMSSPSLLEDGQIVAGPWHRAFGFLVRSGIHLQAVKSCLPAPGKAEQIGIRAPNREIPLVRGYKNRGLRSIEEITGAKVMYVRPDSSVPFGQIGVDLI